MAWRITPNHYDVVVIGSGLPECLVAGSLVKSGKSVLIIDAVDTYGTDFASFTPAALQDVIQSQQQHAAQPGEDLPPRLRELILCLEGASGRSGPQPPPAQAAVSRAVAVLDGPLLPAAAPTAVAAAAGATAGATASAQPQPQPQSLVCVVVPPRSGGVGGAAIGNPHPPVTSYQQEQEQAAASTGSGAAALGAGGLPGAVVSVPGPDGSLAGYTHVLQATERVFSLQECSQPCLHMLSRQPQPQRKNRPSGDTSVLSIAAKAVQSPP
eukprot:XP_001702564.1 predicted protein [Chlamydomonas reinhardtii]